MFLIIPLNDTIVDKYIAPLGRQHQKQILFCNCEEDAVTLLKLHLWPGTIKRPVVAFHTKLMELAEALVLECQVSLRKFCDVLGIANPSSILPTWVNTNFHWYYTVY